MKKELAVLVRRFRNEVTVYRTVMADPRCPRASRWLLRIAVAYALSPIDIVPDFIPLLGHLDDLVLLPLLVWFALRAVPKELILEHRVRIAGGGETREANDRRIHSARCG